MSSSSLERLVTHASRLDILCCLEQESLTISQVSARTGKALTAVAYHVKLLEFRDLVERNDDGEGDAACFVATLDKHPAWVTKAVEDHRSIGRGPQRDQ